MEQSGHKWSELLCPELRKKESDMGQARYQRNEPILHSPLDDILLEGDNKTGIFLTSDAES